MNYELAKNLKDAGFPQRKVGYETDPYLGTYKCKLKKGSGFFENAYAPSLSELIEACGGKFTSLINGFPNGQSVPGSTVAKWEAWGEYPKYCGLGQTSEEAVANLYLKLNEK